MTTSSSAALRNLTQGCPTTEKQVLAWMGAGIHQRTHMHVHAPQTLKYTMCPLIVQSTTLEASTISAIYQSFFFFLKANL